MGLNGLIRNCRNKNIITIDTALAHLCAVMGTKATMLLNYIPDERWKELHQTKNCYGQYLTVLQQTHFAIGKTLWQHWYLVHHPELEAI